MLQFEFMQRALAAAAMVGLIAPLVGVFLVQRRLALLGDGMGHVALTGVGVSFLLGSAPVWTAMLTAGVGAFLVEYIRARSRTAGDLALALLFYSGIAGGVLFASLAPSGGGNMLNAYLFGSLSTVSAGDVVALGSMSLIVVLVLSTFGRDLFAVAIDGDIAQVQGVRVRLMNTLLAVLAAVVVVVGMRVVGLLLVSAIMIVPVAAAQQLSRSFRGTMLGGALIGVLAAVSGLVLSFYVEVPPGPTIVLVALGTFVLAAIAAVPVRRWRRVRR